MAATTSFAPEATSVLLVDDTPMILALYGHILTNEGYKIRVAEDGVAALAILEHETPDLIVLDFMMPGLNGIDVLQQLRQIPRLAEVPVLMLTAALSDPLEIERAFDLGLTDFMSKPVSRRVFTARVRALITGRRDRDKALESATREREHVRLLEELKEAQGVQRAHLPPMPSRAGDWLAVAALVPCAEVGGDLFDVVESLGGKHTAVLIDVSGHGLAAAMVASSVRGILRLLLESLPLERVLEALNRHLCGVDHGHYACVGLVQVDGRAVAVVNAGLPPVVIFEDGRQVGRVAGGGVPPGMLPGSTYPIEHFVAQERTRIVLASDGLTEQFGAADETDEYLLRLGLMDAWAEPAAAGRALGAKIRGLFGTTPGTQADDCTVLVLDCMPHASAT